MRPIKSGPLTNLEIEELDAFLLSDDGLENAMDVSSLDGFLCAVLSGPNVIMPSKWIPWVWDSTEANQSPEFTSEKQAQRIAAPGTPCRLSSLLSVHGKLVVQRPSRTEKVGKLPPLRSFSFLTLRGERRIDLIEFIDIARALGADPVRLFREFIAGEAQPKRKSPSK